LASASPVLSLLALHDALPIYDEALWPVRPLGIKRLGRAGGARRPRGVRRPGRSAVPLVEQGSARTHGGHDTIQRAGGIKRHRSTDRKSTRLNSSHVKISYAVF